ncbi:hypothetical protein J6590_016666 [Homalodisca vitripennis]|nr:hypothetical protein J6590_016666 [Homalodisca vitripennis]
MRKVKRPSVFMYLDTKYLDLKLGNLLKGRANSPSGRSIRLAILDTRADGTDRFGCSVLELFTPSHPQPSNTSKFSQTLY